MLFQYYILLLLLFLGAARAESMNCASDMENYSVSINNAYVPALSRPGDIIATETHSLNVTCKGSGNFQQVAGVGNAAWSSSGLTVNVDGLVCPVIDRGTSLSDSGLGIVWTNRNSANGGWTCMTHVFNGTNQPGSIRRGLVSNGTSTLNDKFYIVRTNHELGYGDTAEINQSIYIDEANADRVSRGHLYQIVFNGSMHISAGGCSFNRQVNVNMGNVSTATFKKPGSVSYAVPFNIVLSDCYGGAAYAEIDLDPVYGYADRANSVMAISNEADAAQGIGIELLMNGKKVADDNVKNRFPLAPGTTTLPFTARYFQTADSVKPGRADSTVLFSIFYE